MSETMVALLVAYGFTLVRNGTYRQQQAGDVSWGADLFDQLCVLSI